jgi:hypothetical protein
VRPFKKLIYYGHFLKAANSRAFTLQVFKILDGIDGGFEYSVADVALVQVLEVLLRLDIRDGWLFILGTPVLLKGNI